MVWPVQFLGDDRPDMPVEYEDELFAKPAVWDEGFQAGAKYVMDYLDEYRQTLTGKENVINQNYWVRADWIHDLLNTQPPPPEEV